MIRAVRSRLSLFLACLALPAAAQALCTSDGVPAPAAVLERFLSADCADCWSDASTPRPAEGTLVLDWVVPGRQGEEAPLATVASVDAPERLRLLGRKAPDKGDAVATRATGPAPADARKRAPRP